MHHFLHIDPASIYLKERFGDALEFPNADNAFELNIYEHNDDFMVLGNDNGSGPLWYWQDLMGSHSKIKKELQVINKYVSLRNRATKFSMKQFLYFYCSKQ